MHHIEGLINSYGLKRTNKKKKICNGKMLEEFIYKIYLVSTVKLNFKNPTINPKIANPKPIYCLVLILISVWWIKLNYTEHY